MRRADTAGNAGLPRRSEAKTGTDRYGCVRMFTEWAFGAVCAMCTGISKAHCCVDCWLAERIAQSTGGSGEIGLIGPISLIAFAESHVLVNFQQPIALCMPWAFPPPYLSVPIRTHPYLHCPQSVPCTKCIASQRTSCTDIFQLRTLGPAFLRTENPKWPMASATRW